MYRTCLAPIKECCTTSLRSLRHMVLFMAYALQQACSQS